MKAIRLLLRLLYLLMIIPGIMIYLLSVTFIFLPVAAIEYIITGGSGKTTAFIFEYIPGKVKEFTDFIDD